MIGGHVEINKKVASVEDLMKKKLLIILGIGLLGATASTYVFYHLISNNFAEKGGQPQMERSLVVAMRDLPRGTQLALADVKLTRWTSSDLPAGAFRDPETLVGKVLKNGLLESEPVVQSKLLTSDERWLASSIPPGMRGVTVHVTEFAGVTQLIRVGDRVDILVANRPRSPGVQSVTMDTLLRNVEVIATGREPFDNGKPNNIPVVTLLVDAKDSERLSLADHRGTIRLVLRHPLDEDVHVAQGDAPPRRSDTQNRASSSAGASAGPADGLARLKKQ